MKPPITVMCDRCGARDTHDDADYVHGRLWCAVCDAWTVHHAVGTLLAGVCDAAQPYWERRECELRRLLEGEGVPYRWLLIFMFWLRHGGARTRSCRSCWNSVAAGVSRCPGHGRAETP